MKLVIIAFIGLFISASAFGMGPLGVDETGTAAAADIDGDDANELVEILQLSGARAQISDQQGSIEVKAIECKAASAHIDQTASCTMGVKMTDGSVKRLPLTLPFSAKLIVQLVMIHTCGPEACEFSNVDLGCAFSVSPDDGLPATCTLQSNQGHPVKPF